MKEIYKHKYSSKISLLWFLILMLISVNSCKKDSKADLNIGGLSLPNLFSQLPEKEKIHSKEILDWVKNLPDLLPTDPFWDKAEQKVIVGRHVVRVPISDDASLYFTKQNDSLKVFVYKWIDKDPGKRLFTGNIISYNFQDERLRLLRYNKSKLFLYSTFDEPIPSNSSYSSEESFGSSWINRIWDRFTGKRSKKNEVNPSFTLASNKLKSISKNLKSVTSSAQAQGLIGALMCFLQGGTYDASAAERPGGSHGGTMISGHCTPGGGAVPRFFDWLTSLLGADGDGANGDDGGGGYIGNAPYNGDPGSSGNNTYIPPSNSSGTTGGGSGGGTTTPPLPPYGGGAIWVSKWVPDDSGGCTPTESGPSNDPNGVSQPGGPVGCPTGGGGHWESYQIFSDPATEDPNFSLGSYVDINSVDNSLNDVTIMPNYTNDITDDNIGNEFNPSIDVNFLDISLDQSFSSNTQLLRVYNVLCGNYTMQKALSKFFGKKHPINLEFRAKTLGPLTRAQTIPIGDTSNHYTNRIIIEIDSVKASTRPDLMVAKTIIHEIIHAEIFRILQLGKQHILPGDYNKILNALIAYWKVYPSANPKVNQYWDHGYMAIHYLSTIARALKEYDNNPNTPLCFYKMLAWEGLEYTPFYNKMSPSDIQKITAAINNYNNSQTISPCIN